jgi:hypothetical protein
MDDITRFKASPALQKKKRVDKNMGCAMCTGGEAAREEGGPPSVHVVDYQKANRFLDIATDNLVENYLTSELYRPTSVALPAPAEKAILQTIIRGSLAIFATAALPHAAPLLDMKECPAPRGGGDGVTMDPPAGGDWRL